MVDLTPNPGEAGCVSELSDTERPVKNTTRKRKLEVSPDIRQRLRKFEKENPTDSPVESFFKQFQYESEIEDERMTRSRRTSSSPRGEKAKENASDKELLNKGSDEKSLEERIREDQDKFMKEIRETLSANITNSINEAISSVQTGVEQKITTLTEKIEGQSGEFNNLCDRMAILEDRMAAL